jgi:hypothetical protein
MNQGRVGEDRGSKETDGCPLTPAFSTPLATIIIVKTKDTATLLQDTL